MEVEELIAALNQSNIDMKAQEGIIVTLNRYEKRNAQESEYFTVLETSKEDMTHDSAYMIGTATARIDKFTDTQMKDIATYVRNELIEHYWDALQLAVEVELEKGKVTK